MVVAGVISAASSGTVNSVGVVVVSAAGGRESVGVKMLSPGLAGLSGMESVGTVPGSSGVSPGLDALSESPQAESPMARMPAAVMGSIFLKSIVYLFYFTSLIYVIMLPGEFLNGIKSAKVYQVFYYFLRKITFVAGKSRNVSLRRAICGQFAGNPRATRVQPAGGRTKRAKSCSLVLCGRGLRRETGRRIVGNSRSTRGR